MTVGSWWVYGANDIDPLGGERPRRRHAVQFLWGRVYEVPMDLAPMALAHKFIAVCLHGLPEVALEHNLLGQQHTIHVRAAGPCMDLEHQCAGLLFVYVA